VIKQALRSEYNVLEASGYSEAIKLLKQPLTHRTRHIPA
jgi:hypothetical protein